MDQVEQHIIFTHRGKGPHGTDRRIYWCGSTCYYHFGETRCHTCDTPLAHKEPDIDDLFAEVQYLVNQVNMGRDVDSNFEAMREVQQRLAQALEANGKTKNGITRVEVKFNQLRRLNKQDFSEQTTLAVRKYRLRFSEQGLNRRVEVYNPWSDYGLANLPPSRQPRYIQEFVQ